MTQTAGDSAISLLVVEDSDLDYELLVALLARDGVRVRAQRVEDEEGMRAALRRGRIDAVVTDHNLPRFDSRLALKVAKEFDADLPVIVVSGEMSEELAVAALHAGADDFILKSRMFRLGPALSRSLVAADDRRSRHRAAAALAESESRLHQLTQHLEAVREDERRRIVREIHDEIGTALTAMKFELVRLEKHLRERHGDTGTVRGALDLLAQVVAASHRIQHNLRPPVLDAGLVAALQWLVGSFDRRGGIGMRFESNRDEVAIAPERAAAIYRVAQESLNNVVKHAQANHVAVQLFASAAEVALEVADDGVGFDPRMLDATPGFGLRGLIERARGLGGWAEVNSAPGRGTSIMFAIPYDASAAAPAEAPGGAAAP
ncbi:MAG TPA: response regulator [Burkholderiaceae bacterium]|nr:response regulator [Burkholderiaceae bacterium]